MTTETNALTGTATFSRKVQPKQYESEESGLYVQFAYDPLASDEAIAAEMERAQRLVRVAVYSDLGIGWSLDANGFPREEGLPSTGVAAVAAAFPGAVVQSAAPAPAPAAAAPAAGGVGPNPPAATGNKDADRAAAKAWGIARWNSNPEEFYDNRAQKASGAYKPTSPDVKHKASGAGVWF